MNAKVGIRWAPRSTIGSMTEAKVFSNSPCSMFDGNVVRQLPQGRNLPTQVLDTTLVVLDEEERELNAPQFLEALVGEKGVQHDER